ncbi:hypothetical protein RCG23_07040 [Neobacillus sp. PS3-34]|uniref:hypothetical protein n=1 Tax=Neobacillus sp. PS3-34 TaxID=3070678 RepID=UPI0027DF4545|nr:hypothetical protein [Neobacillus sp. PS3-34]WML49700.1 hypothetical protein RCG23_07040 [Neobacillus sp. PS3-34]
MEENFTQLASCVNDIKKLIESFQSTLDNIENRLARLEKVDSIEHRVAVNQIDLSDIKESLQRIEELQVQEAERKTEKLHGKMETNKNEDLQYVHRRLDSHLVKIARAEEDIMILKSK